jgi:hypothetical protein
MDTIPDIFEAFTRPEPDESVLISNTDKEPRPLFNGREPAYVLKAERPEHRIIIMLKAAGRTNVEIAEATGTTPVHVAHIVKQPWAVEQILKEIENAGREPVIEVLQGAAVEAAQTLVEVMREAENKETKRKAANDILDRKLGKANQPITVSQNADPSTMTLEEIRQRLSELRAKQN